ncbi:uncharacterized protein N7443_010047 [Penicillium atrosanguineum]|uniref:Uncharacterized protein n=1 Tax=Penicillium atrosanguineum TaxID=1132637 RepID=A0A9W9PRD5_9EURO|nr:uncharacterized protein N7443_010047 [Penicillium atrosanguineum]KAJ5137662.1 hypothetical protein N7526_003895 [Penicillium atrosanguineum]KAJ5289794.1 hypothetical protein N7443_010047 [Penicillium atrosanguineum]KAJ5307616.1 hypothetical protein N7476_008272 [Penicillium atrosanguineum]
MGKAGRVACIFTPYLLTIASLICIIMVGLGCTKASSSTLNNLYFMRVDLQNITSSGSKTTTEIENILEEYGITSVTSSQVSDVLSKLQDDSTLKDFYDIGLWGYCDGDITNNTSNTTSCSSPKSEYYFNPLEVWGLDNDAVKDELPDDYTKVMKIYKAVSKWMFIAYVLAFATTIVEILVGMFAICSRWGSCVTTLFAVLAFLFTTAASVTATVLFSIMDSTAGNLLDAYGIKFTMGKNMYAATWLAVVFSLAGTLFWLFSVCCCSGRSPYNHRNRERRNNGITAEKAPYTYEPLGAGAVPYGNQHPNHTSYPPTAANEYPMTNTNNGRANAYEPFRHV